MAFSKLTKLSIPLEVVIGDAKLILIDVLPYYSYENGNKTDKQLGYKYIIVEDIGFDKLSIKVPGLVSPITREQVANTPERIYVAFTDCYAKPYRTFTNDYDLSISASSISIIK